MQPIAGQFECVAGAVWFTPRFPFVPGASYTLVVAAEEWRITRPARVGAPTADVVAIYPTADEVPANLLRIYLHFSEPMSEGWAARAVRVRRADTDEPLHDVFLPMEPELWDGERRRLTMLLDPGRIKRGLVPNREAGYPLVEGVPIVVGVDPAFRDASGNPLRARAERTYRVGPPVRRHVDPAQWHLHPPVAGTMEPLKVELDRPLDHALLGHCLRVRNEPGAPVAGSGTIGARERSWRFEPDEPWEAGRFTLIVDSRLEDLAGNSLNRVFDRDLTRAADAPLGAGPYALEFECGAMVSSPTADRVPGVRPTRRSAHGS
jgi:hypothetical protein